MNFLQCVFESDALHIAILFSVLLLASVSDIKKHKIPNKLIVIGLVAGFLYSTTWEHLLLKLFILCALFFFGMLHLMGYGDIKLLMVLAVTVSLQTWTETLLLSLFLVILHGLLKYQEDRVTMKLFINSILLRIRPEMNYGRKVPYAPYIFVAFLIVYITSKTIGVTV